MKTHTTHDDRKWRKSREQLENVAVLHNNANQQQHQQTPTKNGVAFVVEWHAGSTEELATNLSHEICRYRDFQYTLPMYNCFVAVDGLPIQRETSRTTTNSPIVRLPELYVIRDRTLRVMKFNRKIYTEISLAPSKPAQTHNSNASNRSAKGKICFM